MKATELRIGNLVYTGSNGQGLQKRLNRLWCFATLRLDNRKG